jgi:hypothetical protein
MKKWFAGALDTKLKENETMMSRRQLLHRDFHSRALSAPILFSFVFFVAYSQRNGGNLVCVRLDSYACFRSRTIASKAMTTAIAMIRPTDIGRKYISDIDVGEGVGAGVAAGASVTTAAVSADEP